MSTQKRIRDYNVTIGKLPTGINNSITDVEGVTVGHVSISEGNAQTGVTAILPHGGDLFNEKLIAASHIINGFGKSIGTIQINELGTIETPILLTNTLSIGTAADALIAYMLRENPEIGKTTGTVNPVVCECNDMILNDIRAQWIKKEHVFQALENTSTEVIEGTVGAGVGMVSYSLKGGIGTSSRRINMGHGTYHMGVLALTNFGILEDLQVNGREVGKELNQHMQASKENENKGSVIVIVATDLPVTARQLQRIIKRSVNGLANTGSIISHGSGEVIIGFSTATKIPHIKQTKPLSIPAIHEEELDLAFRAIGEATEEAVLNSLITATSVKGREGNKRPALEDLLSKYSIVL